MLPTSRRSMSSARRKVWTGTCRREPFIPLCQSDFLVSQSLLNLQNECSGVARDKSSSLVLLTVLASSSAQKNLKPYRILPHLTPYPMIKRFCSIELHHCVPTSQKDLIIGRPARLLPLALHPLDRKRICGESLTSVSLCFGLRCQDNSFTIRITL